MTVRKVSPRTGSKGQVKKGAPRSPRKPAPAQASRLRPPRPGPGRPRKATPPRGEHQAALAAAVETAEAERDAAAVAYAADMTVAAEVRLLRGELGVASSWGSYLRALGDHTHSLKYGDLQQKLAGRLAALRELAAIDQLGELVARAKREDSLG